MRKRLDELKMLSPFRFTRSLVQSLSARLDKPLAEYHLEVLEVFDAAELVKLHCGRKEPDGSIQYFATEGDREEYGVNECKESLRVCQNMQHIIDY